MAVKPFSPEDRARIAQNRNVLRASDRKITYSPDFKVKAVHANLVEGIPPHRIFLNAGFDLDIIGHETPKKCLTRWRRIFAQRGEQGLRNDLRGKNSVGPRDAKKLTVEEKLRRSEARVRYLEKEIEFLKKLDALERAWLADHPKSTR